MKKLNIAISVLLLILILVLCFFVPTREFSEYDIVSGVAIDIQNEKWLVTCEICMPSKEDDFGSKSVYVKGEGYTLDEAFYNASLACANTMYTDSVRIYIISDAAKDRSDIAEWFASNPVNMRAVTVYTSAVAHSLLNVDDTENNRTKSIAIDKKIQNYCFEIKKPVPEVKEFLKNSLSVKLSASGNPERSDGNE